ncbi:hypothetical protein L596_021294 [Steinernema carpocapsae]|uniref:Uncharacterized protein n=1 Tax=Steinernema carpocapsae TaxID=34508 RepID=A0A4U5MI92_STECR|nr:hypothetical protein L596_021294 [Steinernema carpocapsae]
MVDVRWLEWMVGVRSLEGAIRMAPREKRRKSQDMLWFPSFIPTHNFPKLSLSQHFPIPLTPRNPPSFPTPSTDRSPSFNSSKMTGRSPALHRLQMTDWSPAPVRLSNAHSRHSPKPTAQLSSSLSD